MNSDITDLIEDFLKGAYPIRKMKVPNKHLARHALPHKGKFKRCIVINGNNVFRVSDKDERYNAMYALSKIICRVFRINQDESIPIIKRHLHIP